MADTHGLMASAEEIRRAWLIAYGLDAEEIDENILESPPVSIVDESEQLDAVLAIRKLNRARYTTKLVQVDRAPDLIDIDL